MKPNPARGLPGQRKPEPLDSVLVELLPARPDRATWFDVVRLWMYEKIVSDIITTQKGISMQDPKTTVTAILTGVASLLSLFGVLIPVEWFPGIIALGVVVLGFFAGDSKKKTT